MPAVFVIVCVATTGFLASLIGLAPNYVVLSPLLFAVGLSSSAYHPAGSALLTRAVKGKWGSALAVSRSAETWALRSDRSW